MKRLATAFVSLFLFVALAFGSYVDVPKEARIPNYSGSQCVWVSCELVCRTLKVKEGYNLHKKYFHATSFTYAQDQLRRRGIQCGVAYGDYAWKRTLEYLDKGYPVVFGVPGHALVIIGYDEKTKEVTVIDNRSNGTLEQKWSWDRFNSRWERVCLFIWGPFTDVPGQPQPPVKPTPPEKPDPGKLAPPKDKSFSRDPGLTIRY